MAPQKIGLALGALLLMAAGILAEHKRAKFLLAPALYVSTSYGCFAISSPNYNYTFLTNNLGNATITDVNGIRHRIYYTSTCNAYATNKAAVSYTP
jgi:hypothetical protein